MIILELGYIVSEILIAKLYFVLGREFSSVRVLSLRSRAEITFSGLSE